MLDPGGMAGLAPRSSLLKYQTNTALRFHLHPLLPYLSSMSTLLGPAWLLPAARAGPSTIQRRLVSTSKLPRQVAAGAFSVKSTLPSSSDPIKPKQVWEKLKSEQKKRIDDGDRGYLAFTKASLFKLTLPLAAPDAVQDPSSPTSKASSPLAHTMMAEAAQKEQAEGLHNAETENDRGPIDPEPWESRVERGFDRLCVDH